jgi:epoxyqueuosine reductase QueG
MRCVDACPADALTGAAWHPGLPREEILDVRTCDEWKKDHYPRYHDGHDRGICAAVCPCGLKLLKGRGGSARESSYPKSGDADRRS